MVLEKAVVMDGEKIRRTLVRMTHEIIERNKDLEDLIIVCIKNGGNDLGKIIQQNILDIEGKVIPLIYLDIRAYRDDLKPMSESKPDFSLLSVTDKVVVLVDDVLYTGRSVRAALDALNDLGRARKVELAVLIDRGHRELPIRADFVGKNVPTARKESVLVDMQEELPLSSVTIVEGE